jgi:tetrapyrrole methylase family protein/MazG family protein
MAEIGDKFERLVQIMARLRSEDGCPWDREQSHESLRQYLLEEAYEVLEAIDEGDLKELRLELGDLLLQVIFHAQIASEEGTFDISDVVDAITEKLIRRHPHVFGDVQIDSAEEQTKHWEQLKQEEGKTSAVDGVPRAIPALQRAHRVQQKAAAVGFDWKAIEPVWEKVKEELEELRSEWQAGRQERVAEEFGDLLFALVNLARFLSVNPEDALRATTEKFLRRFKEVESRIKAQGHNMHERTLEELDAVWEEVKTEESK